MVKETASDVLHGPDQPPPFVNTGSRKARWNRWHMTCVLVLASLLWWLWACNTPRTILTPLSGLAPADRVPDIGFSEDMLRTWAQYAPYIPAGKYVLPPPVCSISQVSAHTYISRCVRLTHSAQGTCGTWIFFSPSSSDRNVPTMSDSCNDMVHDGPPRTLVQK
jgi:hypothetical protein